MEQRKEESKMIVRNSNLEDIDELVQVGIDGFGNDQLGVTHDKFKSHLKIFPEGQFCVEYNGRLIGSCSSLIINIKDYGDNHTFNEISDSGYIRNHNPQGKNLYGIDVVIHPKYRKLGAGQALYDARQSLCKKLNLQSIVFGGRLPEYYKYAAKLSPEEYVEAVIKQDIYDPVINFQIKKGFKYRGIAHEYLEKDEESLGNAVILEWLNPDFNP